MTRDNFHRLLPGWMTILPGRGLLAGVALAAGSVAATAVASAFLVAAASCSGVATDVCGSLFWTSAPFGVLASAVLAVGDGPPSGAGAAEVCAGGRLGSLLYRRGRRLSRFGCL
jgi:hypothetical protein